MARQYAHGPGERKPGVVDAAALEEVSGEGLDRLRAIPRMDLANWCCTTAMYQFKEKARQAGAGTVGKIKKKGSRLVSQDLLLHGAEGEIRNPFLGQ